MRELDQTTPSDFRADEIISPIMICVLGDFLLLKAGQPVKMRHGKTETLLCYLGLRYRKRVPRSELLNVLWPNYESALAGQSLNSVIYSLHKRLGDAIGGATPVLYRDTYYQLNLEAGVAVDLAYFDSLAQSGDKQFSDGDSATAIASYNRAISLYRGDLCCDTDIYAVLQREHLRAHYLTLLEHLAHHYYDEGDYTECKKYAWLILEKEPSREDTHRLIMRCYAQQGQRAKALHHYQICLDILRSEFNMEPEPLTAALFEQIRLGTGEL